MSTEPAEGADAAPEPLALLEAVMRFTAERNREALASTLLRTMLEVLPAAAVELYPCRPAGQPQPDRSGECRLERAGPEPDRPPLQRERMQGRLQRDVKACLRRLAEAGKAEAHRACVTKADYSLHPLVDALGINGVIAIENLPGCSVDPKMVDALFRIYHNFASVIDDSRRDTLTGLLNRKTFEESIENVLLESRGAQGGCVVGVEHRRAAAPESCHWLAVMDIDHFKRVNDSFGHLYGDEVLLLLARLMLQSFRHTDRVYRFGGEEFAVLLSPCTPEDARAVLERFRIKTENCRFAQVGRVTISIGFVAIRLQDVPATVVGHADRALYASKHTGRNRVTGYDELEHDPKPQPPSSVDLF
jgi:diguanylate cyclase (GGDEF)-like protein